MAKLKFEVGAFGLRGPLQIALYVSWVSYEVVSKASQGVVVAVLENDQFIRATHMGYAARVLGGVAVISLAIQVRPSQKHHRGRRGATTHTWGVVWQVR